MKVLNGLLLAFALLNTAFFIYAILNEIISLLIVNGIAIIVCCVAREY